MEDVTARKLMKQKPSGSLGWEISGSEPVISAAVALGEGWEFIPQNNLAVQLAVLAHRNYVDLSGYTLEDLTTFIQGVDIQHLRDPLQGGASLSPLVYRYDFLTTRRITTAELAGFTEGSCPGFLDNTVDLMEMIYGESRTYAVNANIAGTFITTDSDTLGSGNATAADKLHWTQVYVLNPAGNAGQSGTFQVYDSNLVCQAATGKEKDLVYVERLRRAYTQERS